MLTPPPKPGIRTSEFWLTLAVTVLAAIGASGLIPHTHWASQLIAAAVTVLGALGYQGRRSELKRETLRADERLALHDAQSRAAQRN